MLLLSGRPPEFVILSLSKDPRRSASYLGFPISDFEFRISNFSLFRAGLLTPPL